ncbi:coilin [Pundamilia nyererei]|uniref:Coilin n=1 Tax=Pundamilia nyererei TaxID=303518 RepID=A0A9Y3RQB1_9CICH|nr:PREDICTED: coilin [Pundamilia nyererei]
MAAHGNNFIRLRLYFDYPPPAVVGCRMCWLLVDLNVCRVVADLESVIREKFEFSGGSILSLFIEDCYLPHTESIYVVRDNDSVRVKVGWMNELNGYSSHPDAASESGRKRRRATEDTVPEENGVSVEWKKKKRKKNNEDRMTDGANLVASDDQNENVQGNPTEKKEKKKKKPKEKGAPASPKPADLPKIPAAVSRLSKSTKKLQASKPQKASSSDSSSSSSDEDVVPKKTTKTPTSTPAPSKVPSNTKPAPKKPPLSSSSSSETESSPDEAASVKIQPRNKPLKTTAASSESSRAPSAPQPTNDNPEQTASIAEPPHTAAKGSNSDSEDEIQLVIRRPLQQPRGGIGIQSPWQGRGRGKARCGGGQGASVTGGGRGGASRGNSSSFGSSYNGATEPSYQNDSLTNMSVILQKEAVSVPKQDYNSMPLLAAPPQVGQRIAFKLLELTENYTPEVSEYKEGKIVSFDPINRQIELELLNVSQASGEPGKFDLVYQNPDGSERVEYAVSRGSWVTERWESLLEPRLII